jgi:tripartite-type tricarboxylate transporter receptor subunit TctC
MSAAIGFPAAGWLTSANAAPPYPSRIVRIVVPYPPGGSADAPARIVAQQLARQTGGTFVVDNKPGAGGRIAIAAVLEQPADGYALFLSTSQITAGPALYNDFKYDPNKDFTHIARIAVDTPLISVNASSPFKSLPDLLAYAKANPGKLTYGSAGTGSPGQFAMEMPKRRANVDILHVPYRGAAAAVTDLLAGNVSMVLFSLVPQMSHIKAGTLRPLAVSSTERFPALPNVPTIIETVPDFELAPSWVGISGPPNLAPEVVQYLAGEIKKAMADPSVQKHYEAASLLPDYLGPRELSDFISRDSKLYARMSEETGIKAD